MQFPVVLFLMLGLAAASPVQPKNAKIEKLFSQGLHTRNTILENVILDLLEDFREAMRNGTDKIPVLDPLKIGQIYMDDEVLPVTSGHLAMFDVKICQLSTFIVNSLNVRSISMLLQRYRMNFDIYIPVLTAKVDSYNLRVTAGGYTIFGKGNATVNVIQPRVNGTLVIQPRFSINSGLFLRILESNVHFSMQAFKPQINGLLDDEVMSAFINSFLTHLVPEAVVLYEAEISQLLSGTIMEVGNNILAEWNLGSIFG